MWAALLTVAALSLLISSAFAAYATYLYFFGCSDSAQNFPSIDHDEAVQFELDDLNVQFQQLAEPFLLLDEIENHTRRIIVDKFSVGELADIRDPNDVERAVRGVEDLTFGDYIRLLENESRWKKINIQIDRATFCKALDQVRRIRNDVMHFDPDGIPPADLERLRDFAGFMQKLQTMGVS